MLWLIRRVTRDFPTFERPVQVALVLGIALFVIVLVAALAGDAQLRLPALIGAFLLVLVMQAAVMYGSRNLVRPLTQAQRAYLIGDFEHVLRLLEPLREAGEADMRALTLLGNTYRQLGRLDQSVAVLREALEREPNHHFPLYGYGRTLLAQGDYVRAAELFVRALDRGAAPVVQLDLAEALYRLDRMAETRAALQGEHMADEREPHRVLMAAYLRSMVDDGAFPDAALITAGLPYWQAMQARFAATPYGAALRQDIERWEAALQADATI